MQYPVEYKGEFNRGHPWSRQEEELLMDLMLGMGGYTFWGLANKLGRSCGALRSRIRKLEREADLENIEWNSREKNS